MFFEITLEAFKSKNVTLGIKNNTEFYHSPELMSGHSFNMCSQCKMGQLCMDDSNHIMLKFSRATRNKWEWNT